MGALAGPLALALAVVQVGGGTRRAVQLVPLMLGRHLEEQAATVEVAIHHPTEEVVVQAILAEQRAVARRTDHLASQAQVDC